MELETAFTFLGSAFTAVKTAVAARDQRLIDEAMTVFNERYVETLSKCVGLLESNQALIRADQAKAEENQALHAELVKLVDQKERIAREFELTLVDYTTPVYAPKPGSPFAGKAMYLCAHCAERAQATYLYPTSEHRMFKCAEGHGPIRI